MLFYFDVFESDILHSLKLNSNRIAFHQPEMVDYAKVILSIRMRKRYKVDNVLFILGSAL